MHERGPSPREHAAEAAPLASVTCFADADIVQNAYTVTGLIELADAGEIELQFRLRDTKVQGIRGRFTLWLSVESGSSGPVQICCDFHDVAHYYCKASLASCDLYFKANLNDDTRAAVPGHQRAKLRAFGPYAPSRPRQERSLPLRRLGNTWADMRYRLFSPDCPPSRAWHKLRGLVQSTRRHRRYLARKSWPHYERSPTSPRPGDGPFVFFNPSCWPEDRAENVESNRLRAELIVELRERLGERFAGGFRRNHLAETKYASAMEDQSYAHDLYVRMVQAAPVALYTNGLSGCYSWRLLEELAASKCVVSEHIPRDAPFPLDRSAGIIQCRGAEEMVDVLERLAHQPAEVEALGQAAWRTYEEHLRPATRMRRLLQEVAAAAAGEQRS